jgi:hypothetical protein
MRLRLTLLTAAALALSAAFVSAQARTTTDTQHFTNLVESDHVSDCNGNGHFTETFVSSGVMHTTQLDNGTFHFTVTAQGTDTLVPSNLSLPTYTGHFDFWDGDNLNQKNEISTFTQAEQLKGSDGSTLKFQIVAHTGMGTSGQPVVSFVHSHCLQR